MALTRDILHRFLVHQLGVDPTGLGAETPLFSAGRVDSFALVDLMLFVEEAEGLLVRPEDVTLEHFDTIARILVYAAHRRKGDGAGTGAIPPDPSGDA